MAAWDGTDDQRLGNDGEFVASTTGSKREPRVHLNVGGKHGWTTACGIESSSFVDTQKADEVDCERCLASLRKRTQDELEAYTPGKGMQMSTDLVARLVSETDHERLTDAMREGKAPATLWVAWLRS